MKPTTLHTGSCRKRVVQGFTLTEMLVTMLILALASTLMATGIPVAIDTYHRTVNSANAQVALSTTATVLRTELGTATKVVSEKSDGSGKIFYKGSDGLWASIEKDTKYSRGLVKQYYKGSLGIDDDVSELKPRDEDADDDALPPEPLITDEAITSGLSVTFDSAKREGGYVTFEGLEVKDAQGHSLASIDAYNVMTRFAR
jgi:prepilin-type N-terminal cleavage/methylation domain-containing protein